MRPTRIVTSLLRIPLPVPTHLLRLELAAAVIVAAVVATAASGAPALVPGIPAIYVNYSADCTFAMTVDGGTSVTSGTGPGPTLPPGSYQLQILMPNPVAGYAPCSKPVFTLTGPGVSARTEFPGEALQDERVLPVLVPSSTYVAQDENAPAATRKVFTTAASGSSTSLLGGTGASTGGGSTQGTPQADLVGSAIVRDRGTLVATTDASGRASLRLRGRPVASLTAGRYVIRVVDSSRRAGFFVQRRGSKPVAITGVTFVGKKTKRVMLRSGKWTFFATRGRQATRFTVVVAR